MRKSHYSIMINAGKGRLTSGRFDGRAQGHISMPNDWHAKHRGAGLPDVVKQAGMAQRWRAPAKSMHCGG